MSDAVTPLNPVTLQLAETLVRGSDGRAEIVRDDNPHWLAIEEAASAIAFVGAEGHELHVVPFVGDAVAVHLRPYVVSIVPSWLDGELELVIDSRALAGSSYQDEALGYMKAALDYWTRSGHQAASDPTPPPLLSLAVPTPELGKVDFSELAADETAESETATDAPSVIAQMRANISNQWSWASSAARIPQISDLTIALTEPVGHARVSVAVTDADLQFGATVAFEGPLPAETSILGSVSVPLSARVMSLVEERRGADCAITIEDVGAGRVLARVDKSIDIQPHDLWLAQGDPRRSEQRKWMEKKRFELARVLQEGADHPDAAAIEAELDQLNLRLHEDRDRSEVLSRSLLASFVRPNHPEVAAVAREAAEILGRSTGDPSFFAFQISEVAEAEERADSTVDAIYEALQARFIAYSEPPPGWDYRSEGQRIRDHGAVAKGGLGTCMDTTVLMAAVIEQVGLLPVLVLLPDHIFVGYWRRDPHAGRGRSPEWYPGMPVVDDLVAIHCLVEGGWLGVIETTTFTARQDMSAASARSKARRKFESGPGELDVTLIDVIAARRAGVSPLPAINERADGVTEIIEYRSGGVSVVTEVEQGALEDVARVRQVDSHPARYRTWKSSLFSLNATNALLNLGSNARVQPLVLPPEALGVLEDRLNQDVSFSLHSGYDITEVHRARGFINARQFERDEVLSHLNDRKLFVQRLGRVHGQPVALSPATFVKELRSMAHNAKTARDERGMNPLFLCLGLLRWPYKDDVFAEAPLILVPVNVSAARGRQEFSLSLDASQQTTPNAALIEWLRREHGLSIPGLAEPLTDRAGIDVDGVLSEVRKAVAERGLQLEIVAEARLATLDLSAFRMWQDLNVNAESFLERPLVRHLVEAPTERFQDPASETVAAAATDAAMEDELENLETPIPADSTQKRAVLWARQGRSFVLQGPPGTGKSQTISNMVAECIMSGLRVLFVAEKGTALAVVQRRLEAIGLGPFTLNLHHEGSNATEVRAQLKRALIATVAPDPTAMESARRRLRNARFELMQYPQRLHETNAVGLSAYSAHDELLVLGGGPTMPVPTQLVAHHAEQISALRDLFQGLQPWIAAAGVRPDHPWRLAGVGDGDPFDLAVASQGVLGILDGSRWADSTADALREALRAITHPRQLQGLAAAGNGALPSGDDLAGVLSARWPTAASETVSGCERAIEGCAAKLHGFSPDVLGMDLRAVADQLQKATASGLFGRSKRETTAIAPLAAVAPPGLDVRPGNAAALLNDLVASQDAGTSVRSVLGTVPGLGRMVPSNPFRAGALERVRDRLDELLSATAGLRDGGEWTRRVNVLAQGGHLSAHREALSSFASAWQQLWDSLAINEADFVAWRGDRTLLAATERFSEGWRRQTDFERLLPLQNWCTLVRKLEPLREAGLDSARSELLEGSLPAYVAEDALARGVAQASLDERVSAAGLDRFNSIAHDQRVTSYSEAQREVRTHWATDSPATLLARRGGGGAGKHTGGLARELEKTTRRLGTRPILRKYGEAVQELTPLVLCSPSSVVDLIEPGVMEFDVVIFDEASQITVPEAVGALGRARAAIVVGDSKQMPPTRKVGGGAVNDEVIDDPDVEEIVEDQESILSECELARVPTLSLNWHYRSQDEALIAFSNRTYYGGELSSFPTPTLLSSDTGMEFRRVEGKYLRAGSGKVEMEDGIVAGSNTNPAEAIAIVKAIHELVHVSDTLPSVGIVTFNEQQRQLIEDLLHASADPKVADVMDEARMGRGEALFVKALEQVQGDERDIVVFSIAFSKQANGRIPTNFGPLSTSGGERRLNVAITRARRKNIVFCSFDPSELDVSGSTYNGPKDLKGFLTFAKASGSAQESGETAQRVAIRDRHRDEIAGALREAGLHVMSDVGLSDFRLDLVLARLDTPTRPILPVLLDGESWKKRHTVSDRDVLPVEVLQHLMGWPSVARIWWPMWLQNRQEVIDRVLAEVDRAEATLDGKTRVTVVAVPEATFDGLAVVTAAARPATPEVGIVASSGTSPVVEASSSLEFDDGKSTRVEPGYTTPVPPESVVSPQTSVVGVAVDGARPVNEAPVRVAPEPAPQVPPSATDHGARHAASSEADELSEFVPAHSNVVGPRDVLDALPDRKAAATVREQVIDVIEAEGPIEVSRLTRIVARRFGLNTVRAARAKDITALIPRSRLRKSRLGSFAWPDGLDPATWTAIRFADPDGSRSLDEIAPEEIANAMLAVIGEYVGSSNEDVLRHTAELFGIVRLGVNVRTRLEAVYRGLSTEPFAPVVSSPMASATGDSLVASAEVRPTVTVEQLGRSQPEPITPEGPEVRPTDPVIDCLAQEAASIRPDFGRVDDDLYYDYSHGRPLSADLRKLVNELVLEIDYDGQPGNLVANVRTAHLASEDAESVGYSAAMVWSETVGKALEGMTKKLVTHLAADPGFEPLPWNEDINAFVASRMEGKRPGLVALVQLELNRYAFESGLISRVEEEIKREARAVLLAMTQIDRDGYGFTSRKAKRLQLAEPYISHVKESRRRFVIYWMSRFEGEEFGLKREARYATATRALAARGETRAAISRTLGISTSIMDRIVRENRRDVVLAPDDPILMDLATSLR